MNVVNCLQQESQKVINSPKTILLFREHESSNWYRAYEQSALLMEFFPNNLEDDQRLHPTKKKIKIQNEPTEVIQIGIQLQSLAKYIPGIQPESIDSDVVMLDVSDIAYEFDDYNTQLQQWKDKTPLKESSNKSKNNSPSIYSQPITFSLIMKSILGFSTYKKSEEELVAFIESLREKCASLI